MNLQKNQIRLIFFLPFWGIGGASESVYKLINFLIKKNFSIIPGRFFLLFLYYYVFKGLFLAGKEGFMWSHLRSEVMRMREYKFYEFSKIKKKMKEII